MRQLGIGHVPDLADDFVRRATRLRRTGSCAQCIDRTHVEHTHHAGHDAVGLAPRVHFVDAHVALLDGFALRIVLRCAVGTGGLTATAADAQRGVDVDDAVLAALENRTGRARRQARGLGAVVAGHVDFVGIHVRVRSTLDVLHTPETRSRRQPVLVFACDLASAAADAVDVVVDETQLHFGNHRLVDLGPALARGFPDLQLVEFLRHGSLPLLTGPGGRCGCARWRAGPSRDGAPDPYGGCRRERCCTRRPPQGSARRA